MWTDLTPQEISQSLKKQAVYAGPRIVRRILDGLGFRRQMLKVLPGGDSPHRGEQFRHLAHLIQAFLEAGHPVLSIDTKKKELGNTYRDGKVYCQQALKAFDHDFPRLAAGVIIRMASTISPDQGWITGAQPYTRIRLIACGCFVTTMASVCTRTPAPPPVRWRGSNSCHKHLFKEDRQGVVDDLAFQSEWRIPRVLLEIQPNRTPPVQPRHQSLSGRPV